MLLINTTNLPILFQTVLRRCQLGPGPGVPTLSFDATEAYVAGMCHALKLVQLVCDEQRGVSYVQLTEGGRAVLQQLAQGGSLTAALGLPNFIFHHDEQF